MRVLGRLGIRAAILTNAAGGINTDFNQGALVLISDHLNLQGSNPLIGPNDERFGPRFPDMTQAYWKDYRRIAEEESRQLGFDLFEGVYAALTGPSYETPAEIRYLRTIGADLGGHVHSPRSNRSPPHGHPRPRNFLRNKYGRRNFRSSNQSRRSNGNGRTREKAFHSSLARRAPAHRRGCSWQVR